MKKFIINHFNISVFVFFVIVIFCLYGNSLFYDWTFYDDDVLIIDKQDYLSFSNIKNILTDTVFGQENDKFCRPVLNLSFMFEKYLYGTYPLGYHLTNILLHLFCVFFLYLTLILRYDKKKTLMLCLIFASHPVLVQAVSWIPGRNDTLLTLFIILSFYFLIRFIRENNKKILFFSLHLLFFVLALFTKETAIFVPLFYLALIVFSLSEQKNYMFDIMVSRHRASLSFLKNSIFNLSMAALLYIVISACYLWYRFFVLSYQTQSAGINVFMDSFVASFPAVTKYIANILFPIKLTVFSSVVSTDYVLCGLVLLIFVLLLSKFRKCGYNLKIIIFGFVWFLMFLIPTFILPHNQFYDHRIYLSLTGILLMLSEIIKNCDKIFVKKFLVVIAIVFLLFSLILFMHSQKFRNRDIFWTNALVDCPQSDIANAVMAGIFAEYRAYDLAEEKYKTAISIHKHSKHYVNLAVLYIKMGRIDEAEKCLLKALSLDEYNPEVYHNLSLIYKIKGDMEKAQYMKALFIKIFSATNKVSSVPELRL